MATKSPSAGFRRKYVFSVSSYAATQPQYKDALIKTDYYIVLLWSFRFCNRLLVQCNGYLTENQLIIHKVQIG